MAWIWRGSRFGREEHVDGSGLGEFAMVWPKNRIKIRATYGGLWRFLADVCWHLVIDFGCVARGECGGGVG